MSTLGRPLKLSDDDRAILVGLVQANPLATNDELIASLESRTGIKIHRDTLQRHLRAAGVERRQNAVAVEVQRSEETKRRYGYTDAHRRLAPEQT